MQDAFERKIDYLRVSVTDRCNLRCLYCQPEQGITLKSHAEILRLEEIAQLCRIGAGQGIRRVRITGGEPLIRKNLVALIEAISSLPEIDDIGMTTNGIYFSALGPALARAGLKRVNISLDSLRPERYREVTRGGDLKKVWAGIETALELRLLPVKINVVLIRDFNDDEINDFTRLMIDYPLCVRFIELMPIGECEQWARERFVSREEIRQRITREFGVLEQVRIAGAGPAEYVTLAGAQGMLGFISPLSKHFCASCNRLRLTADGKLRPCLHSNREINLREPLRAGWPEPRLIELFQQAVQLKPKCHWLMSEGWAEGDRFMHQIGG